MNDLQKPAHNLPRLVGRALEARLRVMPAVVVTGARQTGKSTLAQHLASDDRHYFTLDDLLVLGAARNDPATLTDTPGPKIFDEVQRAPEFLHAVKRAIDQDRRPGQFLLTGSANLLLMGKVSESLAGRASYLTLWPMTRGEQAGEGRCGLWEDLVRTNDTEWRDLLLARPATREDWRTLAKHGGFPTPALELKNEEAQAIWFDGYVRTYLERDLQDLASISSLPDFRRLMRAAALRLGQLTNQSELARDVALPQATVHRYMNLLEASYLLVRLPAYAVNRTKRLIKAPKLYWGDTGVALHLADHPEPGGAYLENLILQDLMAWRDARIDHADLFYWRTSTGDEVDFVIETGGKLIPIEIKATTRPSLSDAVHLRTFRKEYGKTARTGLILHDGDRVEWLAEGVLAVPWWRLI